MEYTCLILLLTTNMVFCYYFYNPTTHDIIIRTSLKDAPKGYKFIPPPMDRKERLTKGKTNGQCPQGGFTCTKPYPESSTMQFECASDYQCPTNYKCCSQKCFLHKICLRTTNIQAEPTSRKQGNCNSKQRAGECEKWPYNCRRPYDYSQTQRFKCNSDTECPRSFICCQQRCFLHKICSRAKTQGTKPPIKVININTDEETEREETKGEDSGSTSRFKPKTTPETEHKESIIGSEDTENENNVIDTNTNEETERGQTEEDSGFTFGLNPTTPAETETQESITDNEDIENENNDEIEEEEETEITSTTEQTENETEELEVTEADLEETTEVEVNNVEEEEIDTTETTLPTTEADADIIESEQGITETDIQTTEAEPETTEAVVEVSTKDLTSTTVQVELQTTTSSVPVRSTVDSNAINPDYSEYYYHYDNVTDTNDEDEYDDEYEAE